MAGPGAIVEQRADQRADAACARARSRREPCARGFSRRPLQRRGAGADRALAGLAVAHRAAARAGRRRQKPSRRDLGARVGRADAVAARARRRRRSGRARDRRAGAGESRRRPLRRGARCFICSISRARSAPMCSSPRAARRRRWRIALPDLASRLRALPVVALTAPDDALLRAVMVKLFADRQLAVDESLVGFLDDPHRAFVRGGARGGGTNSTARRFGSSGRSPGRWPGSCFREP